MDGLDLLDRWIDTISQNKFYLTQRMGFCENDVRSIRGRILSVVENVAESYPYYAKLLPKIEKVLFFNNGLGLYFLNSVAFGELFVVVKHLINEPVNMTVVEMLHLRIKEQVSKLYKNGHYSVAAEKAIKEVETCLREIFKEVKNGASESKILNILFALLGENGCLWDNTQNISPSEKDYRKGVRLLFEGLFAAYRNPSAHENLEYSKEEAIEQMILASQLLKILDKVWAVKRDVDRILGENQDVKE